MDENKKLADNLAEIKENMRKERRQESTRVDTVKTNALREKERKRNIKCKFADNDEGCQRKRCDYHHPAEGEHCRKFLNGGPCLNRMCKYRHVEAERRRRTVTAGSGERKRSRAEDSPTRRNTRPRTDSSRSWRDPNTKVCREYSGSGRCRKAGSNAARCPDGLHAGKKQDLRDRAHSRSGPASTPRRSRRASNRK